MPTNKHTIGAVIAVLVLASFGLVIFPLAAVAGIAGILVLLIALVAAALGGWRAEAGPSRSDSATRRR